ncbi:MAG: single-stranded-DNA-specific exonuclease RecJ, partial [Candidatus Gastranaerophilales bacterium]|nr:single-stranded-DNA-specific exonuclease RecJ [Candidatus Gastranaerophilales bacterium]
MKYNKIWNIKQSQIDEELKAACSGNSVLAVLLKNRGIDTKEKVYAFLHPLKTALLPPEVFTDMEKASQRIKYSIDNKENITIYGDFDADGITSTALLYLTLKQLGANVNYYVPDRAAESHGMNTKALVNIISKRKAKLIITVDCGISNYNEVNFANGFKTDVIITDHHEAPELLPAAYAIINPKAPDSLDSALSVDNIQSLNALAGAGVAFKLACKLLEMYNQKDFVHNILPLAAIGTIGDIVDLTGENRIITAMGLELLKSGKNKGAARLLTESGFTDLSSITSEIITYSVVPKINAAGRLESPITALNLLISEDDEVINTSVKTLNDLNSLRQELCEETFNQAKKLYEENISEHKKSIILFSDDWHIGIIGIVCSKLVESYNKPAFLMTRDSNNSNIIRCSCRSIEGINIHAVLSEHKDLFEGFGGHKMAAGFSFDENKIKFENFKKLLSKTIDDNSQNIDFSKITLNADMELSLEDINFENIEAIEKMQPFGTANPAPVFVMNDLKLNQYKFMGQNSNHLKLFLSKNDALILECIKWNCSDFSMPVNTALDIMFSMRLNIFNDKKSIQLILSDIRSEYLNVLNKNSEIKILDHRNKKDILNQVI